MNTSCNSPHLIISEALSRIARKLLMTDLDNIKLYVCVDISIYTYAYIWGNVGNRHIRIRIYIYIHICKYVYIYIEICI
jgi:hypothetical protein